MTGRSHSTDRPAREVPRCELCNALLEFHGPLCFGPPVSWTESPGAHSDASRVGAALETLLPPLPGDGSFLTRRGAGASRSWSVTASSGSVCRRLRRARSDSFWAAVRSQRGMATGRTSGSSKSYTGEDVTTGTAAATPADRMARSIYTHLFSKGAPYIWPGALTELRVWCEDNGVRDPK
jgi:hypothetical protein